MNVLIVCERSGVLRRAFEDEKHLAVSVDIKGARDLEKIHHVQGDALEYLSTWEPGSWDLIIAHPPCTYLANSGARWLVENPER